MAKTKEKLLITGGSGFLGSNLARFASNQFEVYATYNSHMTEFPNSQFVYLDIRNQQQVQSIIYKIKPDLVIHTSALANVDYCQEHPEEAWEVNVIGTENIARASKNIGAKLIHISTDSVFNGEQGMYHEEDTPHPLNIYAKAKLEGEKRAQAAYQDCAVVRTAFYGWSAFKTGLAEWVVGGLREKKTLKMFTDVFFSPIMVNNLCEVLIEMYQRNLSGLYHVAGSQRCSKYQFGLDIAQVFGLDERLIKAGSIADAGLKAPRPKDISLDITKLSKFITTPLLDVKQGIIKFREMELAKGE